MFSSQQPKPIVLECCAPDLIIGFPCVTQCPCPGPVNTVTLANGAVVDLNLLGEIVSEFCPAIACLPKTIVMG